MNVIFLDFDGVIDTINYNSKEDVEKRIKLLAEICHELDCKVVIEASAKEAIDEETMEVYGEWVSYIFDLFNKYEIECIGRTPSVKRIYSSNSYLPMWKEDEIRLYLFRHPEIDHYCVIDDDDCAIDDDYSNSDLNKVRNHLVTTVYYSRNHEEVGLLEKHIDEAKEAMKIDNEVKRFALKRRSVK